MQHRPEPPPRLAPPAVGGPPAPRLPEPKPPSPLSHALWGAGYLVLGVVFEAASRPVVPFTHRPSPLLVISGLAVAFAVVMRKLPPTAQAIASLVRVLVSLAILYWSVVGDMSLLFPFLFEALFRLATALALLAEEFA